MEEDVNSDYQIGVYIDIFPLDNISDSYKNAIKIVKKAFRYNSLLMLQNLSVNKKRVWYKNMAIRIGGIFISRSIIINRLNRLGIVKEDDGNTKYVGILTGITEVDQRSVFRSEWFNFSVMVDFEGGLYYAPSGYDALLRNIYGDYMKMPPIEEQNPHHSNRAWYK